MSEKSPEVPTTLEDEFSRENAQVIYATWRMMGYPASADLVNAALVRGRESALELLALWELFDGTASP